MNLIGSDALGKKIIQALGLPELCSELTINFSAGKIVTVITTHYVPEEKGDLLGEFLTEYELHPIKGEFFPRWDLVKFCQTGDGY